MKIEKLTKSEIDALPETGKAYIAWCGKLPGFGISVRPSGSKSFIAQYDFGGRGKANTRRVTIGVYGKPWTAEKARKEAESILRDAKSGIDRAGAKAKRRAEMTVEDLCDEYLREGCDAKKESTMVSDRGRINRHILPLLGSKKLSEVTRADIERFMRDIAAGKTATIAKTKKHGRAVVTGGRGAATRTVRLLGGIFSYAVARGYIESNPRAGVKVYADGKGERFLTADEMRRLGEALREAETIGLPYHFNEGANAKHRPVKAGKEREIIAPHAVAAIRLLMFTGCRVNEILKLQWEHVDLDRGFLNLADSKTGAKPVILAAPAVAILSELPRVAGNPYVIVGSAPKEPRRDLKRPWSRVTAHAGLAGLRLHDLRHSFASVGALSGMGLGMVGKLLGHASPATTARYAHFADDPLRRASDSIAATIAAAMGLAQPEAE